MYCLLFNSSTPSIAGPEITQWNGIDMWFYNMSLGAAQTYVCHQEECNVLKTEFIKTEDIPERASLDAQGLYARFHKLLDSITDFVGKPGHSYWLYRGNDEISLVLF